MDEERKKQLLQLNLDAWNNRLVQLPKLDTTLKKNTAFVKKLKTSINKDSQQSILKDINTLSLEKYLSEIIISTQEGLLKCSKTSDFVAAIEIVSALHQRFGSLYTCDVISWLLFEFEHPKEALTDKEQRELVTKWKKLIRVWTEFVQVKLVSDEFKTLCEDMPDYAMIDSPSSTWLLVVLKKSLSYGFKSGLSLTIATNFVKRYPEILESDAEMFRVLSSYTDSLIARAQVLNSTNNALYAKKLKAQIRTGKSLEDLDEEFEQSNERFEGFKAAVEVLAPIFSKDIPKFEDPKEEASSSSVIVAKSLSAWANDDERKFYEALPEVPKELIEKSSLIDEEVAGISQEEGEPIEQKISGVEQNESEAVTISPKGQKMTDFLVLLETASKLEEMDSVALKFWEFGLNNKASKNRLLKHLVTGKDTGKCKYYARFLKSNEEPLSALIQELVATLDKGFRSQIHHTGINFRNIVFFCEMIKFKLIPEHVIFHKIRRLILTLTTPNNIDILGIFFETCGKFLLYEYTSLMEEMLSLLEEKRKNEKLTIDNKMAIAMLFLVLKPPSIQSLKQHKREKSLEERFLKTIIRQELDINNIRQLKELLQVVDFNDEKNFKILKSIFTKPEKMNFENILALAHILKNLPSNFKIMVIDELLERIIRNMEVNDYRYNRTRVAQVKYISAIFEVKIISISLIHDLLYKLLTYGHSSNNPLPNKFSEMDPPDDYFRIQLVCVILLSMTPRRKSFNSKFEVFLQYFDYYIWLKDNPIPKDTEFQVIKAFKKFTINRTGSLKEAIERLHVISGSQIEENNGTEDEDEEDDDDEEDEDDDDDDDEDGALDKELTQREAIKFSESSNSTEDEDADDNKITYEAFERKLLEEEERKIEDDLEKEFKKLVKDSMNLSQRSGKSISLNLPTNIKSNNLEEHLSDTNPLGAKKKISFTLLSKKGPAKSLEISRGVKFADNVVKNETERRAEDERIKKYILQAKFEDDNRQSL